MIADVRDFPKYAKLAPKDRIKKFNEEIKALGWNSLGLWVRGNITAAQAKTFVEWSKHAGIRYWKIDGGDISTYECFKAKEKIYPELVLEYITGSGGNINPKWNQELSSYPSMYDVAGGSRIQTAMLRTMQHTDVFRTYDASPLLMSVTTLRRVHDILLQTQQQPKYRAVLNVQDDCNLAVGLGVLVASKRHPNMGERLFKGKDLHHQLSGPRLMQKRINEAERFGRWARIAPAFPAGTSVYLASKNELIDRCVFTPWDTWARQTYGKMVSQSAPAIMARNMPLPTVECDGPPPFVCATTYPNGPTGIATEGRVSAKKRWFEPRAKVTVKIKDAAEPIGIAGHYKSLVLEFAGPLDGVTHVWTQDLLADKAEDIRAKVTIKGNTLTIPGALIDQVGMAAGTKGDISAPGLLLQLAGKNLPKAGEDFAPKTKPVLTAPKAPKTPAAPSTTAKLADCKHAYGYKIESGGLPKVVLRQLDKNITSGTATFTWTMTAANSAATRNGFLVLASDKDATAAILAGAWIGSDKAALLERPATAKWRDGNIVRYKPGKELKCKLVVDMDARTAKLTVNGAMTKMDFSESVTGINYIGFGVQGAKTLFSEPTITSSK